jgi:hypothetical protein
VAPASERGQLGDLQVGGGLQLGDHGNALVGLEAQLVDLQRPLDVGGGSRPGCSEVTYWARLTPARRGLPAYRSRWWWNAATVVVGGHTMVSSGSANGTR